MKGIIWTGLVLAACAFTVIAWATRTGRVDYLVRSRHAIVEVNGKQVPGDVLERELWTVVTRRDIRHERSYWISSFGDADPVGNIGFIAECKNWTANRLPLLVFRKGHFPCVSSSAPEPATVIREWHFSVKPAPEGGIQFMTPEHDRIVVRSN